MGNSRVQQLLKVALDSDQPEVFIRWCDVFDRSSPGWDKDMKLPVFAENPALFHVIARHLADHASAEIPDVYHGHPETDHDWPRIFYTESDKYDNSTHPETLLLRRLLEITETALQSPISFFSRDDLESLSNVSHVGFRATIGSYTETYQSNPDSYSRDENIDIKGLAFVLNAEKVQRLAANRL